MQAHSRAAAIEIDQATFRIARVVREYPPCREQDGGDFWPWPARDRMMFLIAIAVRVGIPSERSEIRFIHGERLARLRHRGPIEGRCFREPEHFSGERSLLLRVEIGWPQTNAGKYLERFRY